MKRELHDGREDGLEPLESIDIRSARNFADLLQQMSKTAFGGRELGEAYLVAREMARDKSCTIVVTISGAMTVAKMGRVLCEMIEEGLAHIIISTGALMAHGLSEAIGGVHYKHDPNIPDSKLYQWGYNRVYDTLEMELNLSAAEEFMSDVLERFDWSRPTCSVEINREIGRRLVEEGQMPSVLGCAYERGVPVYVPAFTDSELGLDVATFFLAQHYQKGAESDIEQLFSNVPRFNPFLDLYDYTRRLLKAERRGIFTVGGGVPRNWGQQIGPLIDIINMRLGTELPVPRFQYGVRICPEPSYWGGLSGCSYSEGVSWGKFIPREEGGRFAEVRCDATIAWPILIRGLLDSLRADSGR
ncbi:MAG: deoxyhypusine synthase [Candidatus Abyssubacteria bacterium]